MVINRKTPAGAVALALASAGIALVFWPQSTFAQTASQITPRSFEPPLQGRGGGIVIPQGAGPEAPAGADKLSVRIKAVRIDGSLPALAGKFCASNSAGRCTTGWLAGTGRGGA